MTKNGSGALSSIGFETDLIRLRDFVLSVQEALDANKCAGAPYRARIQRLLTTVQEVYDLEGNGARSFGGVVMGNVRVVHDRLTVRTCGTRQENLWKFFQTGADLMAFPGLPRFLHEVLTSEERRRLARQLEILLREDGSSASSSHLEMSGLVCGDPLMRRHHHEAVQRRSFRCDRGRHRGGGSVMIAVEPMAPVLSPNLCPKAAVVTKTVPMKPYLHKLMASTMGRFRRNFVEVRRAFERSVLVPKSTRVRGDLSVDAIRGAEIAVKRAIVAFLLQSVVDYKNVANTIRFRADAAR